MIVVYTLGLYDTRVHAYRQTFGFLNRDLQSVILLSRYFAIKRAATIPVDNTSSSIYLDILESFNLDIIIITSNYTAFASSIQHPASSIQQSGKQR